jgi:DNA invertase Pin-like site-specific DNA recombinase
LPDFVAYTRVSTNRQEVSGLGIEAQCEAVERYAALVGGTIVAAFTETESGSFNARPQLAAALAQCRRKKATLLIARLDRLSRSLSFIAQLLDANVEIRCADMPEANRVTLQMMAVFSEYERTVIRDRTRAALAAAKARGVILGANGKNLAAAHKGQAAAFAETVRPQVQAGWDAGFRTLRAMGAFLTARRVPTADGGAWHPKTVQRVLDRLGISAA